ncbi:MAG: hypothetical protein KDK39_12855 [Leptospiraceae bacterium]|nr:hypothetical protein [Leptospiraceae bacterium]
MGRKKAIHEIRIRKMRYTDARAVLIQELNAAFVAGKTRVRIIHGIGSYQLHDLTRQVVQELGLGNVVDNPLEANPGTTLVDLNPPDSMSMRTYLKR